MPSYISIGFFVIFFRSAQLCFLFTIIFYRFLRSAFFDSAWHLESYVFSFILS
jgi:hypothetical protein